MYGEEDSKHHVPRVIRNAVPSWNERPAGYSPALAVQMARAHCWAPYDDVAAALRTLAFQALRENAGRDAAREVLRGLFQYPAPFDVNVQFPKAQVFLPVDHGVFGQCVFQILTELQRVDAAANAGTSTQQKMVDACEAFMKAVASAAAALARPEEPGKPVLYDRAVFQESFYLTWFNTSTSL